MFSVLYRFLKINIYLSLQTKMLTYNLLGAIIRV
nr:MAG TPA: hypothetical protein [Caudoviricetes sp.]